jgi:hypothetical protein
MSWGLQVTGHCIELALILSFYVTVPLLATASPLKSTPVPLIIGRVNDLIGAVICPALFIIVVPLNLKSSPHPATSPFNTAPLPP